MQSSTESLQFYRLGLLLGFALGIADQGYRRRRVAAGKHVYALSHCLAAAAWTHRSRGETIGRVPRAVSGIVGERRGVVRVHNLLTVSGLHIGWLRAVGPDSYLTKQLADEE